MTLLEKIQYHSKDKGFTLASLDRACGFSHGTIRRWDAVVPSVDKVSAVSRILDVSVDYLCGLTDNPAEVGTVPEAPRVISDDDLRFALWNGKAATEAQLNEVKSFAAFVMERDEGNGEK